MRENKLTRVTHHTSHGNILHAKCVTLYVTGCLSYATCQKSYETSLLPRERIYIICFQVFQVSSSWLLIHFLLDKLRCRIRYYVLKLCARSWVKLAHYQFIVSRQRARLIKRINLIYHPILRDDYGNHQEKLCFYLIDKQYSKADNKQASVGKMQIKWVVDDANKYMKQLRRSIINSYFSLQFNYMIFHIFICIVHLLWIYYELTKWPAPRWLDGSVGRVLHRYRILGSNPFQALISQLLKLCL